MKTMNENKRSAFLLHGKNPYYRRVDRPVNALVWPFFTKAFTFYVAQAKVMGTMPVTLQAHMENPWFLEKNRSYNRVYNG